MNLFRPEHLRSLPGPENTSRLVLPNGITILVRLMKPVLPWSSVGICRREACLTLVRSWDWLIFLRLLNEGHGSTWVQGNLQ